MPDSPKHDLEDSGSLDLFPERRQYRRKDFHRYAEFRIPNPNGAHHMGMILSPMGCAACTDLCRMNDLDCQYVLTEICLLGFLISLSGTKARHCPYTIAPTVLELVEKHDLGHPLELAAAWHGSKIHKAIHRRG